MALSPGDTVGPYQVVELLGRGGMGEVYRARDPRLRRDVAIKILPADLAADQDRLRRFEREAQLLASVNHPNIAAIHGVEEGAGVRALVLELVEGSTLAERLIRTSADSPVTLQDALDIARQICDGLDAAHERGIVHRDLKPANIKLTPDGVVKLLDFGLAKAVREETADLTHSPTTVMGTVDGVLLGTAPYMSPEQARGRPVDKRTDIWAFGCVMFEMLSGQRAFEGDTVSDAIAGILAREPDWAALPATTPPAVRRVVRRCLEKDPRQRIRDIADARANLDDDVPAQPGEAITVPPARRRVWPMAAAAAAGAVITAAIVLATANRTRVDPGADNPLAGATFTRLTDFEGAEHDAALSPDGRFVAFRADRDGPFDVWLNQVGSGRFVNLTKGIDDERRTRTGSVGFSGDGADIWLAGGPDRRLRLLPMLGGAPRVFLGEGVVHLKWSPDGTRIVYHTNAGGVDPIFVADRSGANPQRIFAGPYPGWHNHFPTWSRDGRSIYFVSGIYAATEMDLWRIAATGGTPERLTHHNSDVAYPTPIDDRTVVYAARDRDGSGPWLWALDIDRGVTRRVSFGLEQYMSVAASGDGRRLIATVANPTSNLWSLPILDREVSETDVKPYPVSTVNPAAPRFGGDALFYLAGGSGGGLWRYHENEAIEIWKAADGPLLEPPAVSPDGLRVAIVLRRSGKLRLYLRSADGAELQPATDAIEVQGAACWSPDGKWIVTGGRDASTEGLFKIPIGGGAPVRLVAGPALNPVWSPDDTTIVYAGPEVGGLSPLLAVRPDGAPVEMPAIRVRAGDGERARFLPDKPTLVFMEGVLPPQNFWLLDFRTRQRRQLSRLAGQAAMRTFDITRDGRHIVFDRLRENSDIVLIDRPVSTR